ncbi:MAG: SDR family oxidoreductase [Rhizobiaceae bacterium]|nr:SDR family oxidoreductase [Hyphomicrobiales bacterium]NRB30482.1 SDR family oxidoreductase [Rhizobiaceae bacterium]
MKVLIFGCGFSGKAIGERLSANGLTVAGTTRSENKFDGLRAAGVAPLPFDGVELNETVTAAMADTTHLVISIAPPREENLDDPDARVDPVLRAFGDDNLRNLMPKLQWVCYLSTVGVYGNHDGAWMDETAALEPTSARSRQRVRAESEWMQAAETADLPLSIFRLSGIYGPGRNALRSASEGRSRRLIKKGQVFNRIHVRDIAKATELAMAKSAAGIFNVTDDEPAPPQDVVTFAHHLLGSEPPPELDFETAELSPMARSFYGDNKRVSNARSKAEFGMDYDWPNYRAALKRMFDENDW